MRGVNHVTGTRNMDCLHKKYCNMYRFLFILNIFNTSAAYVSMVVCIGTRVALTYYWTSGLVIITCSHFYSWKWRTLFCKIEFIHHHTVKTNIAKSASDHCLCFLDDVFMKWNCGRNHKGGNEGKRCYLRMEGAVFLVVCLTIPFLLLIIIILFLCSLHFPPITTD